MHAKYRPFSSYLSVPKQHVRKFIILISFEFSFSFSLNDTDYRMYGH